MVMLSGLASGERIRFAIVRASRVEWVVQGRAAQTRAEHRPWQPTLGARTQSAALITAIPPGDQ